MHMGIGRDKGRVTVVVPFQAVGYTLVVPEYFVCGPEAVTFYFRERTFVKHFAGELVCFHGTCYVLADIQMRAFPRRVFVPPLDQRDIVGSRMSDLPIYLWNVIVYPTLFYPVCHVCIQVVVVLQSVGVAA